MPSIYLNFGPLSVSVIGLVNLKKRINQGSLVIVSTDKSKRLLLSLENSTWNLAYNTPNTFKM